MNDNKYKINIISDLMSQHSEDPDFFPVIADDDTEMKSEEGKTESIPILPLRNSVLFPGVVIPITVGRDKSLKLIREAQKNNQLLGTCAQLDSQIDDPKFKDLYKIGTFAQIIKILEMPDESTSVIIQGRGRFEMEEVISDEPYLTAKVKTLAETQPKTADKEYNAIVASLKDLTLKIVKLSNNIPSEASFAIRNIENAYFLINFICSNSDLKLADKQKLLETGDLKERGMQVLEMLVREVQMLELKYSIESKNRPRQTTERVPATPANENHPRRTWWKSF
jgi:ATP-dependent Lon protease